MTKHKGLGGVFRTTVGALILGSGAVSGTLAAERERDWTVEDSVAVRYVARSQTFAGRWTRLSERTPAPIVWSPDRQHFFFMTYRGDLARDCPEHELRVYNARSVREAVLGARTPSALPPLRSIKACGYQEHSDKQGIPDAHWTDDSSQIIFTAVNGAGPRQIQRLHVATGERELLSDPAHDVFQYEARGDALVYAVGAFETGPSVLEEYPNAVGTRSFIRRALERQVGRKLPNRFEIYAKYGDASPKRVTTAYDWEPPGAQGETKRQSVWISPNGRFAIALRSVAEPPLPSSWLNYVGLRDFLNSDDRASSEWHRKVRRFVLLDLVRATARPIFDAPAGMAVKTGAAANVLWFSDSARAVIVDTALPLLDGNKERESTSYIIDYDIRTASWTTIDSADSAVKSVAWRVQDDSIEVEAVKTRTFRRVPDGRWVKDEEPSRLAAGRMAEMVQSDLVVRLRESVNEPPQVVASIGTRNLALLEPDPALRDVYRGQVREVHWKEGGNTVSGGLLMPRRRRGERVPLVIQAYSWIADQFLPDGTATSAYAAQALAAQGVAVLFVGIPTDAMRRPSDPFDYTQEGPTFVNRIDSSVKSLASEGLIDERRVGVIGFSRGGYNVLYAITHPGEIKLAAAVTADSTTLSYGEYVSAVGESGGDKELRELYESQYGNKTFWQDKETWLRTAPLFNLDRANTPTLLMYHGAAAVNSMGEILSAFTLNSVPHELLMFPRGTHQLRRPLERQASLQATVDWMTFWLLDKEPLNTDRIKRWAILRNANKKP